MHTGHQTKLAVSLVSFPTILWQFSKQYL